MVRSLETSRNKLKRGLLEGKGEGEVLISSDPGDLLSLGPVTTDGDNQFQELRGQDHCGYVVGVLLVRRLRGRDQDAWKR